MVNAVQIAPFGLRMPAELKSWLQQKAETNRRSVNSEIVTRLEAMKAQEEKQNAAQS